MKKNLKDNEDKLDKMLKKRSLEDFIVPMNENFPAELMKFLLVPTSFISIAYVYAKKDEEIKNPFLKNLRKPVNGLRYVLAAGLEAERLIFYGSIVYKMYQHMF